jgi:flagellar biosynthesis GTPase FlhF
MDLIIQGRRIIGQGLGLPSGVMGFEEIQNRATLELSLNGWRESDLNHARSWLQGILEPQWFDSLIQIRFPDLDINNLWVKAKLEFVDVTFETLKDRADAVIPLFQAGMIPLEKALKILDMEDVLEQMLAEQKKMEKQRAQELEMMKIEREERESQTTGGNGKAVKPEEEEEEEEEPPKQVRQRRASFMEQQHAQDREIQKLVEEFKQASVSQQQAQQKPLIETEKKLKEAEHKLRMQLWEEQLAVTKDLKKQLTSMESPN